MIFCTVSSQPEYSHVWSVFMCMIRCDCKVIGLCYHLTWSVQGMVGSMQDAGGGGWNFLTALAYVRNGV
jgi:hypothetical protein